MLPLALGIEAGSSTQAPLGTVVIGGLVTSTLLSLLVVPTLYLWTATHVDPRFRSRPPRIDLPLPPPAGESVTAVRNALRAAGKVPPRVDEDRQRSIPAPP
jgi:hypothetical protein